MKKRIKRFEAALLSMAILFLTFSGDMVMAADTETQKTTFPVHVIHKTGDDKENFADLTGLDADGAKADPAAVSGAAVDAENQNRG